MRLAYLDIDHLYSLALDIEPRAAHLLAWEIALRFLTENPADLVVASRDNPLGIPHEVDLSPSDFIVDGIALGDPANTDFPASWQIYEPTADLSEYNLSWSPAKAGLYGHEILRCQALVSAGIDRRKAANLLKKYGSISAIIDNIGDVKPKKSWVAIAEAEDIETTARLADEEVPVFWKLPPAPMEEDWAPLVSLLTAAKRSCEHATKHFYKCVLTLSDVQEMAEAMEQASYIGLDTETSGLDSRTLWPVGLSVATDDRVSWYVPLLHFDWVAPRQVLDAIIEALTRILIDQQKPVLMHNAKFDIRVLAKILNVPTEILVHIINLLADTRLEAFDSYLGSLGGGFADNIGLKNMTLKLLGIRMIEISELIGRRNKEQIPFWQVSYLLAYGYAAADADMTRRIHPILRQRLEETDSVYLYEELDHPYIPIIMEMEDAGVSIDESVITEVGKQLGPMIQEVRQEILEIAGDPEFNHNSPQKLQDLLFFKLGLPRTKRTETGGYSTDERSLRPLYGKHPIIRLLIGDGTFDGYQGIKGLEKLYSTYVENLFVHPMTGRLHTEFLIDAVVSGRLSSRNPNLQNIPIRKEIGAVLRSAFIAREGCVVGDYDYSQLELRLTAHLIATVLGRWDDPLVQSFLQGKDPHKETAALMFKKSVEDVTDEERSRAKTLNFGVLYGLSVMSVADRFEMSQAQAKELINLYWKAMPNVKDLIEHFVQQAHEDGYTKTIFYGRRRYFPDLQSKSYKLRAAAERECFNHIIQGSGAEIVKMSQLSLRQVLDDRQLLTKMTLQVHDEVVLEIPYEECPDVKELVETIAPNVVSLAVPLEAKLHFGESWAAAH